MTWLILFYVILSKEMVEEVVRELIVRPKLSILGQNAHKISLNRLTIRRNFLIILTRFLKPFTPGRRSH